MLRPMIRQLVVAALLSPLFACGADGGADAGVLVANDVVVSPDMCPALGRTCSVKKPPSYKNTIAPILKARCSSCHTGIGDAPWPLDTWNDVTEWADLVTLAVDRCTMPPSDAGVPFTEQEREDVRTWLICGSPNN
jgi:hypothetical protein